MKTLETIKDEVAREFQKNPNFIGWSGLINSSKVKVMDRVCERYASACVEERDKELRSMLDLVKSNEVHESEFCERGHKLAENLNAHDCFAFLYREFIRDQKSFPPGMFTKQQVEEACLAEKTSAIYWSKIGLEIKQILDTDGFDEDRMGLIREVFEKYS